MKKKYENDYNQRLADSRKIEDEKYQRQQKFKEDQRNKNKNDCNNTNQRLINEKNEAKKHNYELNVEFDNQVNFINKFFNIIIFQILFFLFLLNFII